VAAGAWGADVSLDLAAGRTGPFVFVCGSAGLAAEAAFAGAALAGGALAAGAFGVAASPAEADGEVAAGASAAGP